ncbi:hypothetical protein E0Z10_g10156 [Xylaria hypoxylon]|uniref:Uncharacterized protein n=1 Tax=Xylaria hypoxylon TaxID=37992 RepID=A0A4Z0Y4C5_9PEZI|nr:hypothetical protein E0Z10_g10156 [Xylaria hypoxylon]
MFASLAVAINMGLEMLETPSGRQALCELGHTFVAKRAESLERTPFAGNLSRMNEYVDHFLERVRNHYPLVAVQREHDSVIAGTIPGLGSTTLDNFYPEDAGMFSYNIERVNSMVAAHEACLRATRQRERKKLEERWQNFIFIFACATLHELAHLFTSYLSLGCISSPPLGRGEGSIGGRWLEGRLYGGSLEIYSGQNHRPDMPGLLFLMDEDYTVRRIDSRAIIQFVSNPRRKPIESVRYWLDQH